MEKEFFRRSFLTLAMFAGTVGAWATDYAVTDAPVLKVEDKVSGSKLTPDAIVGTHVTVTPLASNTPWTADNYGLNTKGNLSLAGDVPTAGNAIKVNVDRFGSLKFTINAVQGLNIRVVRVRKDNPGRVDRLKDLTMGGTGNNSIQITNGECEVEIDSVGTDFNYFVYAIDNKTVVSNVRFKKVTYYSSKEFNDVMDEVDARQEILSEALKNIAATQGDVYTALMARYTYFTNEIRTKVVEKLNAQELAHQRDNSKQVTITVTDIDDAVTQAQAEDLRDNAQSLYQNWTFLKLTELADRKTVANALATYGNENKGLQGEYWAATITGDAKLSNVDAHYNDFTTHVANLISDVKDGKKSVYDAQKAMGSIKSSNAGNVKCADNIVQEYKDAIEALLLGAEAEMVKVLTASNASALTAYTEMSRKYDGTNLLQEWQQNNNEKLTRLTALENEIKLWNKQVPGGTNEFEWNVTGSASDDYYKAQSLVERLVGLYFNKLQEMKGIKAHFDDALQSTKDVMEQRIIEINKGVYTNEWVNGLGKALDEEYVKVSQMMHEYKAKFIEIPQVSGNWQGKDYYQYYLNGTETVQKLIADAERALTDVNNNRLALHAKVEADLNEANYTNALIDVSYFKVGTLYNSDKDGVRGLDNLYADMKAAVDEAYHACIEITKHKLRTQIEILTGKQDGKTVDANYGKITQTKNAIANNLDIIKLLAAHRLDLLTDWHTDANGVLIEDIPFVADKCNNAAGYYSKDNTTMKPEDQAMYLARLERASANIDAIKEEAVKRHDAYDAVSVEYLRLKAYWDQGWGQNAGATPGKDVLNGIWQNVIDFHTKNLKNAEVSLQHYTVDHKVKDIHNNDVDCECVLAQKAIDALVLNQQDRLDDITKLHNVIYPYAEKDAYNAEVADAQASIDALNDAIAAAEATVLKSDASKKVAADAITAAKAEANKAATDIKPDANNVPADIAKVRNAKTAAEIAIYGDPNDANNIGLNAAIANAVATDIKPGDRNGDGKITMEDVKTVVKEFDGTNVTIEDIQEVVDAYLQEQLKD